MARVTIRPARFHDLPPVCVCCGQPATRVRPQEFRVQTGLSAAVLATSLAFGGLAWTERGITLPLPVCEYHRKRGRRANRTFFRGSLLAVVLGVAAYIASELEVVAAKYLGLGAAAAFLGTMVAAMHETDDGLSVTGLTADALTLRGVHRAFAEAITTRADIPLAEPWRG